MNKRITLLACFLVLVWTSAQSQATSDTIYVDPGATSGANDGSSWSNAYTDIIDAVSDAISTTNADVWVKKGTYVAPTSANYTFLSINGGVHLYGGFDGTESELGQRDPVKNRTILSGDVAQDDAPPTSLTGALDDASRSDNTYSVITARPGQNGSVRDLKIDGFTITGGNSRGTTAVGGYRYGGGIYVNPVSGGQTQAFNSVEIENCIFENNSAYFGSAILTETAYNLPTLAVIENCIFRNNYSNGNVIGCTGDNHVVGTLITNCLFIGNTVTGNTIGLISSGSTNSVASSVVNITNSTFADNSITSGNVFTIYAPTVPNGDTIPTRLNVYNSIIHETATNLIAQYGGGIGDSITVRNNVLNTSTITTGSIVDVRDQNNTNSGTPGFVGGGNYALASGSVGINYGTWADYNLWYNDVSIKYSSPSTGLGGKPMSITSGKINAGAYQGVGATGVHGQYLKQVVLNLYPNPTSGRLNVQLREAASIQVLNVLGERVASHQAKQGMNQLDLSALKAGVYFLQVSGSGAVKLIKE